MASSKTAIAKIVADDVLPELVKMDDFLAIINSAPPESFVRNHPMASGVLYIPIDKVELLLTKIFQKWYVEVLREGQMLNAIYVTVRLHYFHPITQEWQHQDGVGAAPIQTDKGASPADLAAIKTDAIMKALPAAESYAVKDAAEKIGRLFGKDLNRKDVLGFTPSYGTKDVKEELSTLDAYEEALEKIKHAQSEDDVKLVLQGLTAEQLLTARPVAEERIKELRDGYTSPIPTA